MADLPGNVRLNGLLSSFLASLDTRPQTARVYENAVRQFWKFSPTAEPTRQMLATFRDEMLLKHKPTTVRNYLAGIKRFFHWLAERGIGPGNLDIKNVRIDPGFKRDCLTKEQARALLADIDKSDLQGLRDFALIALMLTTGLRDCEAAAALVGDMKTISGQAALYIKGKRRDGKDQAVKLAPKVEAAINGYLRARGESGANHALFASISNRNAKGLPMSPRNISRIVKKRLLASGLDSDRITAHSLRHTAATLNLLGGGSLEETRQLLRHSSINTTLIYAHHIEWAERQCESRLADAVL